MGIDIQKRGSGNIGFANAVRVLGWKPGIIVLFGDAIKGFIPVYIARVGISPAWALVVGLVAILAHIFPVWLRFKGGKGVATGLGVTFGISPVLAGLGLCVYIACFLHVRKSAIASIVAAWSLPVLALLLNLSYWPYFIGLAVLGTWTHRTNLRKLRTGGKNAP